VYRVHKGAAAWLLVLEMQNAMLVHWLVVCCDRVLCWAAVLLAFSANVWLRHSSIMMLHLCCSGSCTFCIKSL
jgi:hypothetical protein